MSAVPGSSVLSRAVERLASRPRPVLRAVVLMGALAVSAAACSGEVAEEPEVLDVVIGDQEVLVSGYGIVDAIEVIGDEDFLFAERKGGLYHYVDGSVAAVEGVPKSATIDGGGLVFGGLLDISLHPDFETNRLVYVAYDSSFFAFAVARFELRDDRAQNLEVIYESHNFSVGSRIAWQDSSHFFLTFGVGGAPGPDPGPQDLDSDLGKIHRLTDGGKIPAGNPVLPGASKPSTIWSYGHRNPQGLYYDREQQTLYENEHGPLGGDELNVITKGANYGWPLFSYGMNYDETPVSELTEEQAAEVSVLPLAYWGPDFRVAPSGLLRLDESPFSSWEGSFLLGALVPQHLLRFDPATGETEIVLADVGRVRDVAQLPSGSLLISVDPKSPDPSDSGRIIKLSPSTSAP